MTAQTDCKWVTFDCFGTLVDWHKGFKNILTPVGGNDTDQLILKYHHHEAACERHTPHLFYREVLSRSLTAAAADCGIVLSNDASYTISESWDLLEPFPDIDTALAKLREAGFKLAILTNCDEDLFAITHAKFDQPFDLVITAESVQDYKPALTHFRRFQRVTGATDNNWIHVACSWFHDIVPATHLGIPRIWLDRDLTGEDPGYSTLRITRTSQLVDAVMSIEFE